MNRLYLLTLIAILPWLGTGCSMCCGTHDYDYPTYGGSHERVDPRYGRVGSIFSDPLAGYNGAGADSNLNPQPETIDQNVPDGERSDDSELEEINPLNRDTEEDPDLPRFDDTTRT